MADDGSWTTEDGVVVCRQLGFEITSKFPIYMNELLHMYNNCMQKRTQTQNMFNKHSIVLCPDRENACSDAADDVHAVDMHAGQLLLHVIYIILQQQLPACISTCTCNEWYSCLTECIYHVNTLLKGLGTRLINPPPLKFPSIILTVRGTLLASIFCKQIGYRFSFINYSCIDGT